MTATEWTPPGSAVVSMLGGRLSYQEELGLPFLRDVIADIEAIGFTNEDVEMTQRRYPQLPPFPPEVRPQASIGGTELLIGFGLYMAAKIGEDIIADLVHDIYERIVRPNLRKLWEKLRHERGVPRITTTFDHWFDGSGVLVRVVIHQESKTRSDGDSTTNAASAALRQAVIYLHGHPITHRVLTYNIHEGRIDPQPTLTEPIEPLSDSTQ